MDLISRYLVATEIGGILDIRTIVFRGLCLEYIMSMHLLLLIHIHVMLLL